MANLYLLKYNNYINRLVKKPYATIEEYLDSNDYEAFFSMNFNPNDGATTTHTFNSYFIDFIPNYLLVENEETGAFTRWFVIEARRTRGGQYTLSLKRDVLSDFYNEVLNAKTFINKGYVNALNPLIFNPENVKVNQIKQFESAIKDNTLCAWVVGYLAPNLGEQEDVSIQVSYASDNHEDLSNFEYIDYVGQTLKGLINLNSSYFGMATNDGVTWIGTSIIGLVYRYFNNTGNLGTSSFSYPANTLYIKNKSREAMSALDLEMNYNIFSTALSNTISNNIYLDLLKYNGKVYYDSDNNKYLKVVITPIEGEAYYDVNINETNYPNIYQEVTDALESAGCEIGALNNANSLQIPTRIYYSSYTLTLEEVSSSTAQANVTFKRTNKLLKDAPYKMFCMPISEFDNTFLTLPADSEEEEEKVLSIDKVKTLQIASSIATGLKTSSEGFLYDLQLLPYCPIPDKFILTSSNVNGIMYVGGGVEGRDYIHVKNAFGNITACLFLCDYSSFTTNISRIENKSRLPSINVNDPIDFKTKNETYMFRLESPNFSNSSDFNLFMNYGIDYINVDCTYKPITPYIKININYKGLYGNDFNDQRGLILGGDYSLPVISDAWVNYQIENKNFSAIFERQTQNLEYQHKWNMASTVMGAITGTAAGGLIGGQLGSAGLGAAASAAGGILDIISTSALHAEQMDYRKDMFTYQKQNIQALPQGLVKTSAFNYNSRWYPFITVYNCTPQETEVVRDKIKYSGMTLDVIGSIKDYLNPSDITYIQGKIIRIDINEDYHVAQELNKELNMGVYYE